MFAFDKLVLPARKLRLQQVVTAECLGACRQRRVSAWLQQSRCIATHFVQRDPCSQGDRNTSEFPSQKSWCVGW